jgi:hypothetical protein
MRSKAWLAASVWLRLAHLPPPASRVRRSSRLCDRLAAAPGFLVLASVAEIVLLVRWGENLGMQRYLLPCQLQFVATCAAQHLEILKQPGVPASTPS